MTREPHTVLVCSGGGVYGAAQAGMLAELVDTGFRPDAIVGVSAGALNGTFLAADFCPEQAGKLLEIWAGLGKRSVFPAGNMAQLVNIISGKEALQPDHGLRGLVERCTPIGDLSETGIPVHVGAVCVNTGELVWWTSGPAVPRLCASAALPGVVRPVEIEGRLFFDGGVLANVPIERAAQIGAVRVVVLDVSPATSHEHAPSNALEVLLRAFGHARSALQEQQHGLLPADIEIIRIAGSLPGIGAADFARGGELIEAGRQVARGFLDEHPGIAGPDQGSDRLLRTPWWYRIRMRPGRAGPRSKA